MNHHAPWVVVRWRWQRVLEWSKQPSLICLPAWACRASNMLVACHRACGVYTRVGKVVTWCSHGGRACSLCGVRVGKVAPKHQTVCTGQQQAPARCQLWAGAMGHYY